MTAINPGGADDPSLPRWLLIMRHAKSDRQAGVARDIDRPLNDRGRRDAPRMAAWLRSVGLIPDYVICSPAVRTRQTLEGLAGELPLAPENIHIELDVYEARLPQLYGVLRSVATNCRTILLLGHNPGVTQLVQSLAAQAVGVNGLDLILPTAAIACLAMPADWQNLRADSGRLMHLMTPRQLPATTT